MSITILELGRAVVVVQVFTKGQIERKGAAAAFFISFGWLTEKLLLR